MDIFDTYVIKEKLSIKRKTDLYLMPSNDNSTFYVIFFFLGGGGSGGEELVSFF